MATADVTRVLDEAAVRYELLTHAHTETATAEADALGLAAADVAKTLAVKTPDGYLRAVLPASERLDLRKLREFVGARKHEVHLATEEDRIVAAGAVVGGSGRINGAGSQVPGW